MTISSSTRKAGPFDGNDSTTAFPFTFKVFAKTDITVTLTSSAGVESTLVLDSDYSVALNADQDVSPGGTVTYPISGDELATGEKLTLSGDLAELQPTALTNGGGFFPRVIEYALDRLVIFAQQLREEANRSIKFPVSDGSLTVELPTATVRANKLVGFDADGNVQAVAPDAQSATALQSLLADTDGASLIGYGASTVEDELDDNETRLDNSQLRWLGHNPVYDYATDTTMVYDGSTGDGLHRHFGQLVPGLHGRIHLVYGRSTTHGLTGGMTTWHRYSDDGGSTWSAETEAIPADATLDQRSMSMGVTPTGRLILIYAKVLADSTDLVVMAMRYSDDNGATWTQGDDITTINFTYARAYGRIKLIPGDSNNAWRLAWTPYYRSGSGPTTYKVAAWYSDDTTDGLTWTEGTPIIDDTTGQTETELVAINAKVWFAVTRGSTGLTLYKTVDGGATWTSLGIIPLTSSDSQVAPTLDKFEKDGSWFIVLGYCNRSTDVMTWRVAAVAAAISSASAFGSAITVATDMVNASGYQCPLAKPDGSLPVEGGTAYIEFKEYVGQVYTQVRFVRMDLLALMNQTNISLTVAAGVITVPGNTLERIISVDTEGAAATDELDTINGGRYGQVYIIQGPTSTGTRDVTLKNGTGNLLLENDFRINTTASWIALIKNGNNWIEQGRTNDHTSAGVTIAAGAITVPNSRQPIQITVDTEAAAATDDLDTINGGQEGQIITLFCPTSSRDVTFKHGTGNLSIGSDFTSTNAADRIVLQKQASTWYKIGGSDNA